MLDEARAVFLMDRAGTSIPVLGDIPSPEVRARLTDTLQDRPAARKVESGGMVLTVPVGSGRWALWMLPGVPELTQLAPMLSRAQALSAGLGRVAGGQASAIGPLLLRLAARLPGPAKSTGAFVSVLGEVLVEDGLAQSLVVYSVRKDRVRKIWTSDGSARSARDVLRNWIGARLPGLSAPVHLTPAGDDIDGTLLLERLGAGALVLVPPGEADYGVALVGPSDAGRTLATELPALLTIARPLRRAKAPSRNAPLWRAAAIAAGLAAAVWLLWPVPAKITLSGAALPEEARVAALATDANLVEMRVRVGDTVTEGDVVARFASQQLAAELAQEDLNIAVEDLNAQAAMSENDYGAYQLAQSRRAIAEARRAQAASRIAALDVAAPASGRVISALPQNMIGANIATGRDVVTVQTGDGYLMSLTPSRVDARRLSRGMTGEARFRGLAARYPVELLTPPALVKDGPNGAERLEVIGRITGGDRAALLAGLSGYARIQGETAPRIVGMSHYLIEYLRTVSWTYLGLSW